MTTLTATALPELAAVRLELTGLVGDLVLTRSDDNGQRDVRLMPGQEPINGALIVTDYEPALSGLVTYTTAGEADWVTTDVTLALSDPAPVLHVPRHPQRRQRLQSVLTYNADRDAEATVHWIIDREDPVVISAPSRTRTGSLSILTATHTDARNLEDVVGTGQPVMLRTPEHGLDMYCVITRTSISPAAESTSPRRWVLSGTFTETRSPAGGLLGSAAWTVDDVVESYATIVDVAAAFTTVRDLVVGP